MRYLKFLLCIALLVSGFEGRGQIYIDSYKFAAAEQLLLDAYPTAEAAFSLRKLRDGYTGDCITVRRANGDTSLVGFSSNYLDTAALKTFCGTASTDTCWVRRWFDQSGNARNAEQTTNANQPIILRAGAIFYKDGTPSLDFDGTNDVLTIPSSTATFNFLHNGNSAATFSVHHVDVDGSYGFFGNSAGASTNIGIIIAAAATTFKVNGTIYRGSTGSFVASITSANNAISTTSFILSTLYDADNATAANRLQSYINGSASSFATNTATATRSISNASFNLQIASYGNSSGFLNGGFKELVIYNADQSANRTAIRDNINTFYSIY